MGSLEWHGPARPRRPRSLRNPPILSQGAKLAEKKKKEHCTLHPIRPYSQKLHFKPRTQVMVPMDPSYYAPFSRRTAALLHWKMNGVKKNETEKRHNRCVLSTVKYVHHRVLGGAAHPLFFFLWPCGMCAHGKRPTFITGGPVETVPSWNRRSVRDQVVCPVVFHGRPIKSRVDGRPIPQVSNPKKCLTSGRIGLGGS